MIGMAQLKFTLPYLKAVCSAQIGVVDAQIRPSVRRLRPWLQQGIRDCKIAKSFVMKKCRLHHRSENNFCLLNKRSCLDKGRIKRALGYRKRDLKMNSSKTCQRRYKKCLRRSRNERKRCLEESAKHCAYFESPNSFDDCRKRCEAGEYRNWFGVIDELFTTPVQKSGP